MSGDENIEEETSFVTNEEESTQVDLRHNTYHHSYRGGAKGNRVESSDKKVFQINTSPQISN